MKKVLFLLVCLSLIVAGLLAATAYAQGSSAASMARGGRLYDKWWKVIDAEAPTTDHPLWALQTTNTRSGSATWRCKECHGWDYKGKDGAYGSGSHYTGFVGVWDAAQTKSAEELAAILKGSTNADHDFSSVLDDTSITDLANFLKEGLVDNAQYIDYSTKKPIGGDASHGEELFSGLCAACHGDDGTEINFKTPEEPEYVGTVASGNPWEFLHKVRAGQPGTAMPAAIEGDWSMQDVVDVLAYAQSLPTGAPEALPVTGGAVAGSVVYMVGLGLAGLAILTSGVLLRLRR
ncbi:MAG: c-type cytochrome [Anaerolineae bacterium]